MAKNPEKPEDKKAALRHRSRKGKSRSTSRAEIPIIDIDISRMSDDVPDDVKIALAEAIMAYAAMEGAAERLIWDITGLSYDDGRLLTSVDASNKFETLKKFIENYGLVIHYNQKTTQEMWTAIRQLMPIRNLLVHGIWAMLDGKIPITVSPRLKTTIGNVVGESFPLERLHAVARQSYKVKKAFDVVSERVRASPPVRPARYHPPASNPDENPKNAKK